MADAWLKFFPRDWQADPALRMCSLPARGLWMELICFMHQSPEYGYLILGRSRADLVSKSGGSQGGSRGEVGGHLRGEAGVISRLIGADIRVVRAALQELEEAGVLSRDEDGVIHSRRMVRGGLRGEESRRAGSRGGNPNIQRGTVPKEDRARAFRPSDSPAKTERIWERSGGRCHWCDCRLKRLGKGPDAFRVSPLVRVADGGGNEEANLVAACRKCSDSRALVGWTPPRPEASSDTNQGYGRSAIPTRTPTPMQKPESESEPEKSPSTPSVSPRPPREAPPPVVLPEGFEASPKRRRPWWGELVRIEARTGKAAVGPHNPDDPTDVRGSYIDAAENEALEAAGLPWSWSGSTEPLARWLAEGLSLNDVILPAIRAAAKRPGYRPPGSLRFFEGFVRTEAASAAARAFA